MKRVLIVNPKPHIELGGIENYSLNLINILLKNNYKVFEISQMFKDKNKVNDIEHQNYFYFEHNHYINSKLENLEYSSFVYKLKLFLVSLKVNKLVKKIIKKYKIDVVIDNNLSTYISFSKNVKYIWVQHFDWPIINGSFFTKIVKKILFIKSRLSFPNIVCFTKKDVNYLHEQKKVKGNIVPIILGITNHEYEQNILKLITQKSIYISNKQEIAFIGRLDEKQKNISFLNKIIEKSQFNKKEIKIHVYGEGSDKYLLENKTNIICHDSFKKAELLNVFSKIKLLILPSNYEGLPLIIIEALSHGIPCIIANTFLNASFLIDDSRGKLINNFDPQAWVDAINEIMNLNDDDYQKLSNNCLKFAKENLSLEQFNKKWLELIEN